jgi:hypothetical protein
MIASNTLIISCRIVPAGMYPISRASVPDASLSARSNSTTLAGSGMVWPRSHTAIVLWLRPTSFASLRCDHPRWWRMWISAWRNASLCSWVVTRTHPQSGNRINARSMSDPSASGQYRGWTVLLTLDEAHANLTTPQFAAPGADDEGRLVTA